MTDKCKQGWFVECVTDSDPNTECKVCAGHAHCNVHLRLYELSPLPLLRWVL